MLGMQDPAALRKHRSLVTDVIETRRMRSRLMPAEWFSDPAWDILIDLYAAWLAETIVPISDLWEIDDRSPPLIRRWCDVLTSSRLAYRRGDTIQLTDHGADILFHCIERLAVRPFVGEQSLA